MDVAVIETDPGRFSGLALETPARSLQTRQGGGNSAVCGVGFPSLWAPEGMQLAAISLTANFAIRCCARKRSLLPHEYVPDSWKTFPCYLDREFRGKIPEICQFRV